MTRTITVPGETLYRRKPNGRYEPVTYCLDAYAQFPPGRWVMVVDGNCGCRVDSLPNVDEAVLASLQRFRWMLEDCLLERSRKKVTSDTLSEKKLKAVRDILGDHLVTITTETAGTMAMRAVEEFARRLANHGQA